MNNKLQILNLNDQNIHLLDQFITDYKDEHQYFRYFHSREPAVIKNHLATFLVMVDDQTAGYGHLDTEHDKVWLGIALKPKFQSNGLGNLIMNLLISQATIMKIPEVHLSVDNDNMIGWALYNKFGFTDYQTGEKSRLMKWRNLRLI